MKNTSTQTLATLCNQAAANMAASVNEEGQNAQIDFLTIVAGMTEEEIMQAAETEKKKQEEPDEITQCGLCEKNIWFRDSYSPNDEAICAECDTEVTERAHPPSLNPETDPAPPVS